MWHSSIFRIFTCWFGTLPLHSPVLKPNFDLKRYSSLKFMYSEKSTKFCEIFTLLLSYVVPVKSKVKISWNFVALSEYMNIRHNTWRQNLLFLYPWYLEFRFEYLYKNVWQKLNLRRCNVTVLNKSRLTFPRK